MKRKENSEIGKVKVRKMTKKEMKELEDRQALERRKYPWRYKKSLHHELEAYVGNNKVEFKSKEARLKSQGYKSSH